MQTEIAAGYGGPEAVEMLQARLHRKRMIDVISCLQDGTRLPPDVITSLNESLELFDLADPRQTQEIIKHPAFGALAAELRAVSGVESDQATRQVHRLGGFAAAAALRSENFPFAIKAAVEKDNSVSIPTLGRVLLGPAVEMETTPSRFVTIERDEQGGTRIKLDDDVPIPFPSDLDTETPHWRPTPRIKATANGLSICLEINDVPVLTERFTRPEENPPTKEYVQNLQKHLVEAWELLTSRHPKYAQAIAAGMRSIIPLDNSDGQGRSATSSAAFGAAAMTEQYSAEQLALSLVHEFQHSKLNGIMGLTPLIVEGNLSRLLYAPWRDDPRPERGLLHGVYAHAAIVEFWQTQIKAYAPGSSQHFIAELEFARWGRAVERTLKELDLAQNLNADGRVFLEPLRQKIAGWEAEREELSNHARRLASFYATDHEISWQLANRIPNRDDITAVYHARGKQLPEKILIRHTVDASRAGKDFMLRQVRDRRSLALFSKKHWDKTPGELRELLGRDPTANELLMTGNIEGAQLLYVTKIGTDIDDVEAWGGLFVSAFLKKPRGWYTIQPLSFEAIVAIQKEEYKRWLAKGNTGSFSDMCLVRTLYTSQEEGDNDDNE